MWNEFSPTLKVSIIFQSQHNLKVQNRFWKSRQSLNCKPYKSKSKKQIIYTSNIQKYWIYIIISKGKYGTKARPKPAGQTPNLMVLPFQLSWLQHTCLGLVLLTVYCSPWHMPHDSSVSNILVSLMQSQLHFHTFASQGLLPSWGCLADPALSQAAWP